MVARRHPARAACCSVGVVRGGQEWAVSIGNFALSGRRQQQRPGGWQVPSLYFAVSFHRKLHPRAVACQRGFRWKPFPGRVGRSHQLLLLLAGPARSVQEDRRPGHLCDGCPVENHSMTQPPPRPCRPRDHLKSASELYPSAWGDIEHMRTELRGRSAPDWPEWCFLPVAGAQAAVANDAGIDVAMLGRMYPERIADAARLAGLAAWRMTQGIYRFDPAVYEAVRDTPVAGDIPHEILYRMPEWCVYMETPGMRLGTTPMFGAFAHLEHDVNNGRAELRLLLDTDEECGAVLTPLPLHLGAWSLAESIARMLAIAESGLSPVRPGWTSEHAKALGSCIEPVMSLLLYVCTQAGEITGRKGHPGNPQPVRTRRGGWRVFPVDGIRTWDVGVRLGAALRQAYADAQTGKAQNSRASVRGHVRRAHWHTYLSGPRTCAGLPIPSEQRRPDLRWMPPIPVALPSVDDLPATVRPVRNP